MTPVRNIIDTVIGAGTFTSFAAAIKAADMTDALVAKGPFTVFAPTDEAFRKLPSGAYEGLLKDSAKLKAVLNYHIASGYFTAWEMNSGEVMTLQGATLKVAISSSGARVNGARITQGDIVATNGIVHAIDEVVLPEDGSREQ